MVYKTLTMIQTSPQITNPIRPCLLSCRHLPSQRTSQTQIRRPIRRFRILPSWLLLWKKTEIADQLALNRAEFEGIDTNSRSLIEGFWQGQYIRTQLTDIPCGMIEIFDPIYLVKSPTRTLSQVPVKRQYSRTLTNNDPLMFSLCWRQFQSIPNLLFSWRPLHPHANA